MNEQAQNFAVLCDVLGPPSGEGVTRIQPAGPAWLPGPRRPGAGEVVLWGRDGSPFGTNPARLLATAAAREWQLLRSRGVRGAAGTTVVRLPARRLRPGARARTRAFLASGAALRLTGGHPVASRLDQLLVAAGCAPTSGRLVAVSGGVVVARARSAAGPVLLRAARPGSAGDPARSGRALAALARWSLPSVPRLLAGGVEAGLSWTAEQLLPGGRPAALTAALIDDVVSFAAGLPALDPPPRTRRLGEVLAERLPDWAAAAERFEAEASARTAGVPSVVRHGDFWSGNLLATDGRLTGVVDWDALDEHGLPGVDLLHLLATEERIATRRSSGQVLTSRPLTREPYRSTLRRYWEVRGLGRLDDGVAEGVAAIWWASQTADDLVRRPWLAEDLNWVDSTVKSVLRPWRT